MKKKSTLFLVGSLLLAYFTHGTAQEAFILDTKYYQPFDYSKVVDNQWIDLYKSSLTQTQEVEKASIQVEDINGPILILTGNEDKMWPSSQMGEMIVERLKKMVFRIGINMLFMKMQDIH